MILKSRCTDIGPHILVDKYYYCVPPRRFICPLFSSYIALIERQDLCMRNTYIFVF